MDADERTLRAYIAELDRQMAELTTQKSSALQQLADMACPYKVGQVTEIKGWAYTGQDCTINKITGCKSWSACYTWRVDGLVMKKDGTVGKQKVDWNGEQE